MIHAAVLRHVFHAGDDGGCDSPVIVTDRPKFFGRRKQGISLSGLCWREKERNSALRNGAPEYRSWRSIVAMDHD